MRSSELLNLGCGEKVHPEWTNVDMVSRDPQVVTCNLLEGLPFPDGGFSVVYHSQLLEHLPREEATGFLRECRRVLRPGGLIRVVVPDLENIAREYLRTLDACLKSPSAESEADYDWMLLELLDQSVRTTSGGGMAVALADPRLENEGYVLGRTGRSGEAARTYFLGRSTSSRASGRRVASWLRRTAAGLLPKAVRIGRFRLGGEVHHWMYDRYSLARVLHEAGFKDARVMSPTTSQVPDWDRFGLDTRDGVAFDPTSLFMEARA